MVEDGTQLLPGGPPLTALAQRPVPEPHHLVPESGQRRQVSRDRMVLVVTAQFDLVLSPKRDAIVARHFLQLALWRAGQIPLRVTNVVGHAAYAQAITELKSRGELSRRCCCPPALISTTCWSRTIVL